MGAPRLQARYRRIVFFFANVVAGLVLWEIVLPHLGLRAWVRRTRSDRYRKIAVRFRALAIRMGGVMIKVGQFLSSRLDVLPPEITDELSGLQDEVPPEPFPAIRQLAEMELGSPLSAKYAFFDETPLAAASLGQVHRARLLTDESEAGSFHDVVVKIQRPYIEQLIEVDLSALRQVGGWLERYRPIREHADVRALIREFSDTVREEIDYLAEGHNAETFLTNFKDNPRIHVPRVVWSRTTKRVLTLEDVYAIKITDYEAITAAGVDRGEVASELLGTYLKQIFEDGFFHADPHPGNLFITPSDGYEEASGTGQEGVAGRTGDTTSPGCAAGVMPAAGRTGDTTSPGWRLTFVDFGMVGRVPAGLRDGLREMVIAIGTRDAGRVVRAYQKLDILLPGADLKRIEQAEAQVFDRFWGMSMSELRQMDLAEIRRFGHQFRDLMLTMPFQVPHDLLMLVRTVAILSGMCTGLDPDFNLWNQLAPYAQKLVAEEVGGGWDAWLNELGEMLKTLLAVPGQASRVLSQMEGGTLQVQTLQLDRQVARLERAINRLVGSVIFAALALGGALLYHADDMLLGGVFLAGAMLALVWVMLFAGGRDLRG
jgi:predicted unusual protein kinase regulating ubiquinone biosynthesis (AarF/ABC1/UbiB family)